MRYTTGWAKEKTKTEEQWQRWVKALEAGDRVLFQQFCPKEDSCLGYLREHWRFWDSIYLGPNRVSYGNDSHPINNGIAVYWNSDKPHGKVFGSRIVPMHSDLFKEGSRFIEAHAPVFDPNFGPDRCFVIAKHGNGFSKVCREVRKAFPYRYSLEVNDGLLFVIFGEETKIKEVIKEISQSSFLYSEAIAL